MSENMNYRHLIDEYLAGRLSSSDKVALDKKLAADPELRGEFEIQKNIINAIRETRRMELKSKLNNIQIQWYHTLPGSWKIAAAISVLTLSSLSAFFYIDQVNLSDNQQSLGKNSITELQQPVVEIPEKPVANILEAENNLTGFITENPNVSFPDKFVEEIDSEAETEYSADQVNPDREDFSTRITLPDIPDEFEAVEELKMSDATNGNLKNFDPVNSGAEGNLEIATITDRKYNFHYKLSNGNLMLFGNFEDHPYEILEINSRTGKSFYLNFKEKYYRLENTITILELTPISDETLINELNIVKDNK